jgi:N-formylglutamate amidohydrolase
VDEPVFLLHGPADAPYALVLDSPHSGHALPADFGAAAAERELRDAEDCHVDALWLPAAQRGVPLLAAQFPRTYIDLNRHAGDLDPELLAEPWPDAAAPSEMARLGKALLWRTLDDGRPIYARQLGAAEVQRRIAHYHQPYHAALRGLLDAAHARHGCVWHLNCHSMNAVSGVMARGGAGVARADIVLGDRDGSTCAPAFTVFVQGVLAQCGYDVKVNQPFKGAELVRAYSDPANGRHSLQVEINKRLYMDADTLLPHAGFASLQAHLVQLIDAITERFIPAARHA